MTKELKDNLWQDAYGKDCLLVLDSKYRDGKASQALLELLRQSAKSTTPLYIDIKETVSSATVDQLTKGLKKTGFDLLISLGSGYVASLTKALAIALVYDGSMDDFAKEKVQPLFSLPWLEVMTEGVDGNEICPAFVLSDKKEKTYVTIRLNSLRPMDVLPLDDQEGSFKAPSQDDKLDLVCNLLDLSLFSKDKAFAAMAKALLSELCASSKDDQGLDLKKVALLVGTMLTHSLAPLQVRYVIAILLSKCPDIALKQAQAIALGKVMRLGKDERLKAALSTWLASLNIAGYQLPKEIDSRIDSKLAQRV
mgnify:CR=1 FL=1